MTEYKLESLISKGWRIRKITTKQMTLYKDKRVLQANADENTIEYALDYIAYLETGSSQTKTKNNTPLLGFVLVIGLTLLAIIINGMF